MYIVCYAFLIIYNVFLLKELNNHPAFTQTIDEHNLSPLMEGLQQLKYQSDSKEGMY